MPELVIDRARLKELTQRLEMGRGAAAVAVERAAQRFAANIVTAWVLTIPGAGTVAAVSYLLLHLVIRP